MLITTTPLCRLVSEIFVQSGCSSEESDRIARHLASANLTGHDSHGVIRVPRYVNWLSGGNLNADQSISRRIVQDSKSGRMKVASRFVSPRCFEISSNERP